MLLAGPLNGAAVGAGVVDSNADQLTAASMGRRVRELQASARRARRQRHGVPLPAPVLERLGIGTLN